MVCDLIEFRTDLFDDNLNFLGLGAPKKINYLNFSNIVKEWPEPWSTFSIDLALSQKVIIQKRIVYDLSMMLGDVGGLYDFLNLCHGIIFWFFSSRFLITKMI